MTEDVKRAYRSALRTGAAARTRARIRAAGEGLFVEHGFTGTTMKAVAVAAEVSERTVYTHYRTKVDLFQDVLNVAVAGDEVPIALADRPPPELSDPGAGALLDRLAADTAALMARAGPLIMVAVESARADPDMRRIADEGERATRAAADRVAASLLATGEVRPGLTRSALRDVLATLVSPHVHTLLSWPADAYREWLAHTLRAGVLR